MDFILKKIITSQLIIYTIRCLIGFVIGYQLMLVFPKYDLFWLLLSVILVISPEGKDSRKLTIDRVRSNFIGSFVGLFYLLITKDLVIGYLMVGIIITTIICYLFKVMNMARVAIVALLIILLQPRLSNIECTPIVRFATVSLGCLLGLMSTVLTSIVIRKLKKHYEIPLN